MTLYGKCNICNKDFHSNIESMGHNCSAVAIQGAAIHSRPQILRGAAEGILSSLGQTASKNDQEKVDLSLIPYVSNIEHAKAFMVGEKKYGRYNYCKGHTASQLIGALKRHADAWFDGEERDPKDGQHHLGSVMACCSMILRQMELGTLKDNRYKKDD